MRAKLPIAIALVVGCGGGQNPTSTRPPANARADSEAKVALTKVPVDTRPRPLALLRDEVIKKATWTSEGAVVALSEKRFWWLRPEDGGVARTTPIADGQYSALVAASKADVAIVTDQKYAHVFRGAINLTSFRLGKRDSAVAISEDGAFLVTDDSPSSPRKGRVYDVATGQRLAEMDSIPILSPGPGELLLARDGVHRTRDGSVVVAFGEKEWAYAGAWIDGRTASWTKEGLVIADPKAGTVERLAAKCKDFKLDEVIEAVDHAGHAVRYCGAYVIVVPIKTAPLAAIEVPMPPKYNGRKPQLRFAVDDGAPLLDWHDSVDKVDLATRTLKPAGSLGMRLATGHMHGEPIPSPDGKHLLLAKSGVVSVTELAAKRDVLRLGIPLDQSGGGLVPFLHQGGLDIVSTVGSQRTRTRIGPDAPAFDAVPPLSPQAPCGEEGSSGIPPNRTLSENAAIFEFGLGSTCLCVASGCSDPKLPKGILARHDDQLLVLESEHRVSYLEKRVERGGLTATNVEAATFVDDGKSAAILFGSIAKGDEVIRETALPALTLGPPLPIHLPLAARPTLMATARSLVVARFDLSELQATVYPRSGDGVARLPTEIDAWIGGGVARFPDGRFELFGEKGEGALVCLDSSTNVVKPLATCREGLEAKGVFRIE